MIVDAIVLAGGRSSRLGGVPKSELVVDGTTLLGSTLAAVDRARAVVVVGDQDAAALPPGTLTARESPRFGGPVVAIAAGVTALRAATDSPCDCFLVLACDMPRISEAVEHLLGAFWPGDASAASDGVVAVDESGRQQPLAAIFRASKLEAALAAAGSAAGQSVFAVIDRLELSEVRVPPGSTHDIDTWADAAEFGLTAPADSLRPIRQKE